MLAPFKQFHLYRLFKEKSDEVLMYQINIYENISYDEIWKKKLTPFISKKVMYWSV